MANLCQAYGYGVASLVCYECDEVQQAVIRCDEFRLQRLGATKSMVVLSVGDHVLVEDRWGMEDSWIGVITQLDFNPDYHLIWRLDNSSPMSLLRNRDSLTKIDPVFSKLLTVVNKEE